MYVIHQCPTVKLKKTEAVCSLHVTDGVRLFHIELGFVLHHLAQIFLARIKLKAGMII
jgi:hypothetical protein